MQFLYPSEEETHKLLRFLLDKLANASSIKGHNSQRGSLENVAQENNFISPAPSSDADCDVCDVIEDPDLFPKGSLELTQDQALQEEAEVSTSEQGRTSNSSIGENNPQPADLTMLGKKLSSLSLDRTKLERDVIDLEARTKLMEADTQTSSEQFEALNRKYAILKVATDIALDSSLSEQCKFEKLKLAVGASQEQLDRLKLEWELSSEEAEREKSLSETSSQSEKGELRTTLKQWKEVQQQIKDVSSKLKHREEQVAALSMDLETVTKGPSRSTYVLRITELIKNSKKQENDIAHIINELHDLQRESNANQGRLKRTHALVDELIFRDAKRDPICRQAYRLLSSIHENFADCYERVFLIDKVHRELEELQASLEALEKFPVDLNKVQADIDAVVAENQLLERKLSSISQVCKSSSDS